MKHCTKCKTDKSSSQFYKNRRMKDGLNRYCKQCVYYDNPEKIKAQVYKSRASNPEKYKALDKKHKANRRKKRLAEKARRRADKKRRTPVWADLVAIKAFYDACPEGHHVDHIVPLKGKNVSGLHVLSNLQYLTAHENMLKSNSFISSKL